MNVAVPIDTSSLLTAPIPVYLRDEQYHVHTRSQEPLSPAVVDSPLLTLLRGCHDVSTSSAEVVRAGMQNGFLYDVNPHRASVVRGLTLPSHARILELGCRGGALTRFLAEQGHTVVGIEPSLQLAACAAERCRGLTNVTIVSDALDAFLPDGLFDIVVCVDPMLPASLDPVGRVISRAKDLLKPTGSLVLALGNPSVLWGEGYLHLSSDHSRGATVSPQLVGDALFDLGFRHHEMLLAFPSHASPTLLVHPSACREQGVEWRAAAPITAQVPLRDLPGVQDSFSASPSGIELSPGVVVVAHRHRVHSILWGGWGAVHFALAGAETHASAELYNQRRIRNHEIPFDDANVATWVQHATAPKLYTGRDTDFELERVRGEFAKALAQERELYAGLAREEANVRVEFDSARTRIGELERVLQHAEHGHRVLLQENGELRQRQAESETLVAALTAELHSVRLQYQALVAEMQRLQVESQEAKGKVLTYSVVLEGVQKDLAREMGQNTQLRLREKELGQGVALLSERIVALESATRELQRHSDQLESELTLVRRGWRRRLMSRLQRLFVAP